MRALGGSAMLTRRFESLRLLYILAISSVVVCTLASSIHAAPKPGYKSFIVGNAADAQPSPSLSPGLVLMGGGTDVDAAFQWMCQQAGGGDFVVIRTTGTDAYNPYIQDLCPQMDSVETIIITSVAGANNAYVSSHIQNAEALWIAGGDQSTYTELWRGTAVQTGVNFLMNSKLAPVGGTSAGAAVMSLMPDISLRTRSESRAPVRDRALPPFPSGADARTIRRPSKPEGDTITGVPVARLVGCYPFPRQYLPILWLARG